MLEALPNLTEAVIECTRVSIELRLLGLTAGAKFCALAADQSAAIEFETQSAGKRLERAQVAVGCSCGRGLVGFDSWRGLFGLFGLCGWLRRLGLLGLRFGLGVELRRFGGRVGSITLVGCIARGRRIVASEPIHRGIE
ncbi:MAG TPA: hypothetical protein VGI10_04350 [Polyangiaceae bacterium]